MFTCSDDSGASIGRRMTPTRLCFGRVGRRRRRSPICRSQRAAEQGSVRVFASFLNSALDSQPCTLRLILNLSRFSTARRHSDRELWESLPNPRPISNERGRQRRRPHSLVDCRWCLRRGFAPVPNHLACRHPGEFAAQTASQSQPGA
jgi:hypothetical protein